MMTVSISEKTAATPLPNPERGAQSTALRTQKYEELSAPIPARKEVNISGRTLLMTHFFELDNPAVEPPVLTYRERSEDLPLEWFLTVSDRELMADIYQFAQEEGVHMYYVNALAFGLAHYRQDDEGRRIQSLNNGKRYDLEGHRVTYSFTEKDEATAKRIQNGESIKTAQLDSGWLRHVLDKDRSSLWHPNFEFLEQVINKFSSSGVEVPPLGGRFSTYVSNKKNFIEHRSAEAYDLWSGTAVVKRTKTVGQDAASKSVSLQKPSANEDLATVLRRIVAQYLKTSGISTLFELIARRNR